MRGLASLVFFASRSVWTRRTFLHLAGFTGDDTSCAVFSSFVLRPRCSASGRYEPEGHLCCVALWLVLLVAMHITLCFTFGCRQVQDARRHGRFGPELDVDHGRCM